jgi:hypothetical protein
MARSGNLPHAIHLQGIERVTDLCYRAVGAFLNRRSLFNG